MDKKKYLVAVSIEGKNLIFDFKTRKQREDFIWMISRLNHDAQFALSETVEA